VKDAVTIDVPKGAYVPVFTPRNTQAVASAARAMPRWVFAAAVSGVALAIVSMLAWSRMHAPFRIAVLPLINPCGDSSSDFADALTDEIIHNLSVIEGLEVRSRTSSFVFKDKVSDVHDIARQLQVDYIVEGSALRDGDQLQVAARLIRARDDVSVWSG